MDRHEYEHSVDKARAGCRVAFARLWVAHAARVRARLARRLPAHLVDDVVQDVALAALRGVGGMRDDGDFTAWVLAIATRRAADACRQLRRDRLRVDRTAPVDDAAACDLPLRVRADQREVLVWLRRLPRCHRRPLWLRYVRGCNGAEIAARLHTTPGTVRVALHRALRCLRDMLAVAPCA